MEDKDRILQHFEGLTKEFDGIYISKQKSLFHKMLDISLRSAILKKRLTTIINLCGDISGKDILDIGCGPGRYSLELAKRNPRSILGIDISNQMINLATAITKTAGLQERCVFKKIDFLDKDFKGSFDIIIAAGIFDYTCDPPSFLLKIRDMVREKIVLSFPIKWTLLTPARKLWLNIRKCPNFYYTKSQINNLLNACDFEITNFYRIGSFIVNGNYIVVCKRR